MNKIKSLNRYQKGILVLMAVMPLLFGVIYFMTIQRVGFLYMDTILMPSVEGDTIVYSGKVDSQKIYFTVAKDKTVMYGYGDKTYGPYTAIEDETAIPKDEVMADEMIGVELRKGKEILFRGGIQKYNEHLLVYSQDDALDIYSSTVVPHSMQDANGNLVDSIEPSVYTILELMYHPKLTHKGHWSIWFLITLLCILNAISILYADELFRFFIGFRIQNAENAEPSDWEITGRYIGWILMTIVIFSYYMVGLQ